MLKICFIEWIDNFQEKIQRVHRKIIIIIVKSEDIDEWRVVFYAIWYAESKSVYKIWLSRQVYDIHREKLTKFRILAFCVPILQ